MIRGVTVAACTGVLSALGLSATARANGYCGSDHTASSACPISANGTVSGSYAANVFDDTDVDFFVFYARPGTSVSLTINDTEAPTCSIPSSPNFECGDFTATLYDHRGNQVIGELKSTPSNGIAQPASASARLKGGTYYVETGGFTVENPLSYTITVDGSPGVRWPAPCRVPDLRHPILLATAKRELHDAHCAVGRIVHRVNRHVRHGDAYALHPGGGTYLAAGAPVEVIVSGRPGTRRTRRAQTSSST